jgi:prepilin-type N-terminal cleavage/methylation domain-containing protein
MFLLRQSTPNEKGFTMIELITVIVLMSIVSVMAAMGLVQIASGYYLAKTSTVAADQAQVALARMVKELSDVQAISAATATSITYTRAGVSHTLNWTAADQPLSLDGDTLIDNVQSFSLTYHNTYSAAASSYSSSTMMIELSLQLKGYNNASIIFSERVVI